MKRLRRIVAVAAVVGLAGAGSPARAQSVAPLTGLSNRPVATTAATPHGSIQGIVSDERGLPLPGAMVSAFGTTIAYAVSDTAGHFELKALPPGAYIVRAHLEGYATSAREIVQVRARAAAPHSPRLRRLDAAIGTTGVVPARPIMAAGALPVSDAAAAEGTTASAGGDDHGETAWRLRHLKRTVLRDTTGRVEVGEQADLAASAFDRANISFLGRAFESPARLASALFGDFPFTGQVNLLTTSSFDRPQDLFAMDALPRGIAFVSIGAPAGRHGDWALRGAMTQGDLSSWILAGSFVSRGPGSVHNYELGLSYSVQRYDGGNPAALAAVADGSRNVGLVYGSGELALAPWLAVNYAGRYARYGYIEGGGLFSPRVGFTVSPTSSTRVRAQIAQRRIAPGADEFLPPSIDGLWLPPERTFSPVRSSQPFRAERSRYVEIAVEHDLADAYVIGVRRFVERVDDQLVTLFGVRVVSDPRSDLGHYYVGNAGNVELDGWAVSLSHSLAKRLRGAVDYTVARATWSLSPEAALISLWAPSAARQAEEFHDVTTSVETEIPETATRVFVVYKINTAFTRPDDSEGPGADARFDVQVNQALPFMPFTSTQWEVLLAVRNLFRDSLIEGSTYDELLVARPPKRIVGGLRVRF
jgi:hypothetical protein